MNDRELLEMAAKAAGMNDFKWRDGFIKPMVRHNVDEKGRHLSYDTWNPLTDDGDALRLAIKLQIDLEWQGELSIEAYQVDGECYFCADEHAEDFAGIGAATRLAIVRAAAEIGKAMP